MPRERKDGKYLNTYISREVVETLDEYSKHTGISKAFIIENALRGYINSCLSQGYYNSPQVDDSIMNKDKK